MKKMFSLALALIMALALAVPAFATATTDTTELKITSNNNDDAKYEGYRLLGLTSTLNCEKLESDGHEHIASDCYIYSYKVNDTYTEILKEELGITDPEAHKTIDQTIMDAIAEFDTSEAIRAFAESVLNRIITADPAIEADVDLTSGEAKEVQQGYWLIVDVTEDANVEDGVIRSLVMLDTAGQPALDIIAKDDMALLTKVVDDRDTYIGQTVNYSLDYKLPYNLYMYDNYTFIIEDSLEAGLTLDRTSIVVKINNKVVDSSNYTLGGSGNQFSINMSNYIYENRNAFFTFPVQVTYSAVVNDDAVIAGEGNNNIASLTYTNDPSAKETATITASDVVYTYAIALKKVNAEGEALADATFQFPFYVQKDADTDGAYIYAGTTAKDGLVNELTTPESGEITIKGVESGNYVITETVAPDGYNKLADTITVTAEAVVPTLEDPAKENTEKTFYLDENGNEVTEATSTVVTYENDDFYADAIMVVNKTGIELPSTGGMGTTLFYIVGGVMAAGAAILLVTKKKLANQE